jgi:glycerol-3-phosphate dehydrogenase (NAD+)
MVHMLMRDEERCKHINEQHENSRYLPGISLPPNLQASTDVHSVLSDAQYVIHALPVQASRAFLASIKDELPPTTPVICVSKGIEQNTGFLMSEVFPSALGRKQPCVFLSGPSFAQEVRTLCAQTASSSVRA